MKRIRILTSLFLTVLIFAACSSSDEARMEAEKLYGKTKSILILPYVSQAGESLSDVSPQAKEYLFFDRNDLIAKFSELGYKVVDYKDVADKFPQSGNIANLFTSDEAMDLCREMSIDAVLSMDIAWYKPSVSSSKEKIRNKEEYFPYSYRFSLKLKHTGTKEIIFSSNFLRSYDTNGRARTQNRGYADSLIEKFTNKGF